MATSSLPETVSRPSPESWQTEERLPPQSLVAEQATIGAALVDAEALDVVATIVETRDFYREAHRLIWAAMLTVRELGSPVDLVTTCGELRRTSQLEGVGGPEYLMACMANVPTSAHAPRYALEVQRTAILREAISLGAAVQGAGYDNPADAAQLVGDAIYKLEVLQQRVRTGNEPRDVGETLREDMDMIERAMAREYLVSTVRTGIPELDERTGGLEDAGLMVVKGDTNAGKSGLLRQIVLSSCIEMGECGHPGVAVLFALEEKRWRWRRRSLGWLGHFNTRALRNRPYWQAELERTEWLVEMYQAAAVEFGRLPLLIGDDDASIGEIEAYCKRIQRKQPIAFVCIDYLQKIGKPQASNEEQAFREVAQRLVRLRDTLGCPIIGASQITESKDGSRNTFGARAFEHEADTTMELYRERDDEREWKPECVLQIAKTRELESCRVKAWTDFSTGRWYGMTEYERMQGQ